MRGPPLTAQECASSLTVPGTQLAPSVSFGGDKLTQSWSCALLANGANNRTLTMLFLCSLTQSSTSA